MTTVGLDEAARSNADWCDAFCRAHGIAGRFDEDAWSSPRRTPPLYPDAVTLDRSVSASALLSRVDAGSGCSIKDSFADVDLTAAGFEVLFRAEWLARRPTGAASAPNGWSVVRAPAELAAWESAWQRPGAMSFFPAALLAEPDVAVLIRRATGRSIAGAVANRSARTTGLSNVFALDGDLESAWSGAAQAAEALWGSRPLVGYDSGDDLAAPHTAGFVTIGDLVVWLRS